MITQNCDEIPVLNLMHRPDPKRPPHMQDKRTVVPLEKGGLGRVAAWHGGAGRGTDRAAGAGAFQARCQRPGAADHLAIAFVSNVITKMGFGLFSPVKRQTPCIQ